MSNNKNENEKKYQEKVLLYLKNHYPVKNINWFKIEFKPQNHKKIIVEKDQKEIYLNQNLDNKW